MGRVDDGCESFWRMGWSCITGLVNAGSGASPYGRRVALMELFQWEEEMPVTRSGNSR